MNNKRLNTSALDAIANGAEVVESGAIQTTRRTRGRERKLYRSFSLSMAEEDYNKFNDFLDRNSISSGSAFIRDLLKDKGVFE